MRGREQRRRGRRREQVDREPTLVEPTDEWVDVGGRRMFVVGYTSGGAPYGCYEDEFDEGELLVTREEMALGPFLTNLERRLGELSAEALRRMLLDHGARLPADERVGFLQVFDTLTS
jgi:hypothetical protein